LANLSPIRTSEKVSAIGSRDSRPKREPRDEPTEEGDEEWKRTRRGTEALEEEDEEGRKRRKTIGDEESVEEEDEDQISKPPLSRVLGPLLCALPDGDDGARASRPPARAEPGKEHRRGRGSFASESLSEYEDLILRVGETAERISTSLSRPPSLISRQRVDRITQTEDVEVNPAASSENDAPQRDSALARLEKKVNQLCIAQTQHARHNKRARRARKRREKQRKRAALAEKPQGAEEPEGFEATPSSIPTEDWIPPDLSVADAELNVAVAELKGTSDSGSKRTSESLNRDGPSGPVPTSPGPLSPQAELARLRRREKKILSDVIREQKVQKKRESSRLDPPEKTTVIRIYFKQKWREAHVQGTSWAKFRRYLKRTFHLKQWIWSFEEYMGEKWCKKLQNPFAVDPEKRYRVVLQKKKDGPRVGKPIFSQPKDQRMRPNSRGATQAQANKFYWSASPAKEPSSKKSPPTRQNQRPPLTPPPETLTSAQQTRPEVKKTAADFVWRAPPTPCEPPPPPTPPVLKTPEKEKAEDPYWRTDTKLEILFVGETNRRKYEIPGIVPLEEIPRILRKYTDFEGKEFRVIGGKGPAQYLVNEVSTTEEPPKELDPPPTSPPPEVQTPAPQTQPKDEVSPEDPLDSESSEYEIEPPEPEDLSLLDLRKPNEIGVDFRMVIELDRSGKFGKFIAKLPDETSVAETIQRLEKHFAGYKFSGRWDGTYFNMKGRRDL
jgi:hypothetical protein